MAPAGAVFPGAASVNAGAHRFRRWLALLLCTAAVLRVALLAQSASLPLLDAPLYDSDVYLHQARQILAHRFGDPSLVAFSPLYGWALAVLGASVRLAVVAQLALGVGTLALLVLVARRRAGEAAALWCGVLWLGYGLPLFYETKILSETLGLALAIGGLSLFLSMPSPSPTRVPGLARPLVAGVVLALATLARASLLFTLPFYPLAALVSDDPGPARWRPRLLRALAVTAGMAAVLVGNGLWNRAHTGLFVPVILVSRTASVATHHPWSGDFRAFASDGGGAVVDVSPWDVVRQAEQRIEAARSGTQPPAPPLWGVDLAGWISNAPSKLAGTLADRETTFDYGYYGERSEIGVLGALPVSFGLLEVLGLAGAIALVMRRRARALVPLLPLVIGTLVTTTLFYPTSRYRLPLALPLVLLAAELPPAMRALSSRPTGARATRALAAALLVLIAAFSLRTITRRPERPADWELRVAEAAARAGDRTEAERRIIRARALAPDDPAVAHRIDVITRAASNKRQ